MPSITIDGRPYFYEDSGEGTPLLLLHGFPFTSQSFKPQLEKPPKGVRVIAPDHNGFGRSTFKHGISTMESMAEDALALLDALKIDTALVGGVSMGGYVAIALTRLDPSRVRGLVLIDTQSTADDEAGKAKREQTAQDVEKNGVKGLVEGMLPKLLTPEADPALRNQVEVMMLAQFPAAVAAAARGMATRTDGKDILSRFSGPCAVIVGAKDTITPVEKARQLQALVPDATLDVIENAAHLPNLEQTAAFDEALERFVVTAGR
ncbi:MAG: alpha/beta hydrolase [Archangium gephyra]|uniref:Alpha/beta hydrolase n=1 Tax=Archangium gephyra TaxID=48 RepID=A0A2W5VLD4_9BACT|nr:MAG: alpha/beta hydrolase [Archangium gephyra]